MIVTGFENGDTLCAASTDRTIQVFVPAAVEKYLFESGVSATRRPCWRCSP